MIRTHTAVVLAMLALAACGTAPAQPTETAGPDEVSETEPEPFVPAATATRIPMGLYAIAPSPHLATRDAGLALDREARDQFEASQYAQAAATFLRAAAAFCEDAAPPEGAPCTDSQQLSCKNAAVATYNAEGATGVDRLQNELEQSDARCAAAMNEVGATEDGVSLPRANEPGPS